MRDQIKPGQLQNAAFHSPVLALLRNPNPIHGIPPLAVDAVTVAPTAANRINRIDLREEEEEDAISEVGAKRNDAVSRGSGTTDRAADGVQASVGVGGEGAV